MAHRHKMHHRARGGRTEMVRSNVETEAGSKKDGFRRGGKARHHGLEAHGRKPKARADKRARGGGVTHSPFSSAARGNDMGRHAEHKDQHQPRADGGGVFARGGRTKRHAAIGGTMGPSRRPSPFSRSHFNFGHHHGAGHEEPAMTHPPLHEKHGGTAHHRKTSEHHHAGHGAHHAHHPGHDGHHHGHHHGAHLKGEHKARGRKHRAHGGKVDDEDEKERERERDDEDEEDGLRRGGKAHRKHGGALSRVAAHIHKGGLHRTLGIPEGQKIPKKKIEQAAHSSNPKERKEGILAETFEKHRPH